MPIESMLLNHKPVPFGHCPRCDAQPFEPFLRGEIQRWPRRWLVGPRRPYCALICRVCMEIVGWEEPIAAQLQAVRWAEKANVRGGYSAAWESAVRRPPQGGSSTVPILPLTKGYQADPATRPATMTPPPGARSMVSPRIGSNED